MIVNEKITSKVSKRDILWACGPDVITTIYNEFKQNYKILFKELF